MIVSHRHNFIFLKTRKTAGTSMEIALSKFCGPRDIITPIGPKDEQVRSSLGYRSTQNRTVSFSLPSLRYVLQERRIRFHNHVAAQWVRGILGERIWNSYFKFSIERNPWDKAISLYYWRTRHAPEHRPPLMQFLRTVKPESLTNQQIYTLGGELAVDHVIRYEQLPSEMKSVQQMLGLPESPELPRAKGTVRKNRDHYSTLIGEQERDFIAEKCAFEIGLLGYRFEQPSADYAA